MTDSDPKTQASAAAKGWGAWLGWAVFGMAVVATFLLGLLAASILQRREEARQRPPLVPIARFEPDSSHWGLNYPREYDSYRRMSDDTRPTKYAGGPPRDYLVETPANVVLFAGYAFSKEYRQARGHVHSIADVTGTQRVTPKTPATVMVSPTRKARPRMMARPAP